MKRALALVAALLVSASLRAALPSSDAFGYSASSAPFGWTDIAGTGVAITSTVWLPNADDGAVQVDLPFNFRFYGGTYTKVYLCTNGFIQFGASDTNYAPNCLNLNSGPFNIAAAYWMDLDPSAGGSVHKELLNVAPNRSIVLQFTNVPPRLGTGNVTFQIVINEDSSLDYYYLSTSTHDSGASASAGLRSDFNISCPNHTGLPISCSSPSLGDGVAIHIAYPSGNPSCGTATNTSTRTISPSFTKSFTRTFTPTITPTHTHTPTATESSTITPSFSVTASFSVTESSTDTPSITETHSASPSASETLSATMTGSITPTDSETATASPSATVTPSTSDTATVTESYSASPSASVTPSFSETSTETPSATITPSFSVTESATDSPTATVSDTRTSTGSPTDSPTRTISTTASASPTVTPTFTATATLMPAPPKPACLVLGQLDFISNSLNAASAAAFRNPAGVALDTRLTPFRVYLADSANHRVLYWNDASTLTLGGPADGVIGQSSFSASSANQGGSVSSSTLSDPQGLAVDPASGALWVADSDNHRILRFSLPLSPTGSVADRVLGQAGFSANSANQGATPSASTLNDPQGLSVDAFGHLAVADSGNHRVLHYMDPANSGVADRSWGQNDSFSSMTPNLGGVGARSLSSPGAALLLANQLWVADTGNHRVLQYSLAFPLTQAASVHLGQPNFSANSANRGFGLTNDDRFDSPRGLAVDLAGRLLVADTNNHRVIGFEPPILGQANLVWGQSNLGQKSFSVGNDRLFSPVGIAANGSTLFIADRDNHRAIAYGCGAGLQPSTATPTFTGTSTKTPTYTPTPSVSISPTRSESFSPSPSFSASPTRTLSNTRTLTFSFTPTPTASPTFSVSPTFSRTPTVTISLTPTDIATLVPTLTPYPQTSNDIISYPNPATRSYGRACFAFPPAAQAEIRLYDLLGQPVAMLGGGNIQAAQGIACWDLRASDGNLVAPGLYYVRIVSDGQARLAKLTVSK